VIDMSRRAGSSLIPTANGNNVLVVEDIPTAWVLAAASE
jgi:hypothetical protein